MSDESVKRLAEAMVEKLREFPPLKALTQGFHTGGMVGGTVLRPGEIPVIVNPSCSYVPKDVYDRMAAALPPEYRDATPRTFQVGPDGEITEVFP